MHSTIIIVIDTISSVLFIILDQSFLPLLSKQNNCTKGPDAIFVSRHLVQNTLKDSMELFAHLDDFIN